VLSTEVILARGVGTLPSLPPGAKTHESPEGLTVDLPARPDVDVNQFLSAALAAGCRVLAVAPRKESLEDFFVRKASSEERPR
jgi:hypothetical protein